MASSFTSALGCVLTESRSIDGDRTASGSCRLLLLRHGIAADPGPDGNDVARPLTAAGRRRTRAVLQRLVQRQLVCDRLFSSPLVRARQTAELAVATQLAPAIELAEPLAPGGDAQTWLHELGGQHSLHGQSLVLVGHEPDLSSLAASLIGASASCLQLKKAGVAVLQWWPEQQRARLQLLMTPKLLLP